MGAPLWGGTRPTGRHPGWPDRLRSLRTPAGTVTLRPVRFRDGREWSRLRLRDEAYLTPWEPMPPGRWADHNALVEWPGRWGDHVVLAVTAEDVLPDGLVGRLLRAGRAARA